MIKPREVFHWIYFKNDENRQKFIEIVKKENFEIIQTQYNNENDFPYVLQIKRVDKVGYSDIDEYTLYLWNLAKENNGEYDGWETSVETE
ncbi:ribonuclease E inhibitor RraB [Empedobacter falsenii]